MLITGSVITVYSESCQLRMIGKLYHINKVTPSVTSAASDFLQNWNSEASRGDTAPFFFSLPLFLLMV